MALKAANLEINDLKLIEHSRYPDERGWFMEIWNRNAFAEIGIGQEFMQANVSRSRHGVLRGLHLQKAPFEQAKLVRCISGEIFDVAVDLRRDSETFGKYGSAILSDSNAKSLFIPRGFAHGFLVTSQEDAIVEYFVDNVYSKESEGGIRWNDPSVGVRWPSEPKVINRKDGELPLLGAFRD